MKIENDKVVLFHYSLVNTKGDILDNSKERGEPLPYLHGHKNIVPGLEEAMAGKVAGDSFTVSVPPEKGYGFRDEAKVQVVDRASFEGFTELEEGMVCQMEDDQGELQLVGITKVDADEVTVDANHPFAGITLSFDVEIVDVRDATSEELEQGRVELS